MIYIHIYIYIYDVIYICGRVVRSPSTDSGATLTGGRSHRNGVAALRIVAQSARRRRLGSPSGHARSAALWLGNDLLGGALPMQTSAGPRGAAHPSHLSSRTRDCAMGAVPLCRRERAQLGPAAAAAGLSLAAPILSAHASHHARSRLSTLSCRRPVSDLPPLLFALEGPTAGEPAADAADDGRRFFRSLCDGRSRRMPRWRAASSFLRIPARPAGLAMGSHS